MTAVLPRLPRHHVDVMVDMTPVSTVTRYAVNSLALQFVVSALQFTQIFYPYRYHLVKLLLFPLSSDRQYLNSGYYLEDKKKDYQNCSEHVGHCAFVIMLLKDE